MNKVLVRSAEYVIGFSLAIVCNQFGINAIGNSAPLANNRGKFTRFAIAIRVSHFFILNEIATNKHENPAANINNERNKTNITVKLNSARIKPVGITIAIRKTNEHWINAFITVDKTFAKYIELLGIGATNNLSRKPNLLSQIIDHPLNADENKISVDNTPPVRYVK